MLEALHFQEGVMETTQCAHVGTLVEDRSAGTVCTNCGEVVSVFIEEDYKEWRRDSVCDTKNGPKMTRQDANFLQAACERLSLPADQYRVHVENYFQRQMPKVYERNKQAFLAALIVVISRMLNHPRIGKEVAVAVGLRQEDIHREMKGIEKVMESTMNPFQDTGVAMGGDIVPRILATLFVQEPIGVPIKDRRKFVARAKRLANEIEDSAILGGRTPSTIAAVAVYMTKSDSGTSVWTKTQVARAAHLSSFTLSKAIGFYCAGLAMQAPEPEF